MRSASLIRSAMALMLIIWSAVVPAVDFSGLFQQVDPSVVILRTWSSVPGEEAEQGMVSSKSLGSGVVISSDGKILTAAHVVHTVDAIHVEFVTGEKVLARVVSSDPGVDLAVLKLDRIPQDLTVATLGDSDAALIGQEVAVIGAPYGFGHSLSVGHISSRREARQLGNAFQRGEFIQVDAAVNQGNSGGPVFNLAGEVVGIVSHIQSKSGGSEGLGFAVSSNSARRFVEEGPGFWSGLTAVPVTPVLASAINYPMRHGALVQDISEESPAAKAGIRGGIVRAKIDDQEILLGGDVIVSVESISVGDEDAYSKIIATLGKKKTGEPINILIYRKGVTVNLSLVKP